ncbi:MAG TPA: desulfoferrodoxin [Patescibacteria group bacterium]|nr:desulfoferrodoxin [Patescibacteria group bacterium]
MPKMHSVYKCNVCGNIVILVHSGKGELVCCGQPMELKQGNSIDATEEKHVPVVKKTDQGLKIKVGEDPHPMSEEHHIEWIELLTETKSIRRFLKPGEKPEAVFSESPEDYTARAYCNLHGLWKK